MKHWKSLLAGPVVLSLATGALAGVCGDPKSGDCTDPNGIPGCNDTDCCNTVCGFNPLCCETGWDELCVELAIELCGIFVYECEVIPGQPANDCVADALLVSAGDSLPFDSTNANTDGPDQPECGSAKGDDPIHKDLWYYLVAEQDGVLTASTCNITFFDTKIAIYDLGTSLPSEIDPLTLPGLFVACNEDCGDAAFASEQSADIVKGGVYLVRVGGYLNAGGPGEIAFTVSEPPPPPPPPYTCDDGGPIEVTQSNDPVATEGQVACAGGGITTANQFARSFVNGDTELLLECVDFGFSNSGGLLVGNLNIYIDTNGGAPTSPDTDLDLIASIPVSLPGTLAQCPVPGFSNCCCANGGVGCDDDACEATVCAVDAFCCDTQWDGICADEAIDLCGDLCADVPPPADPTYNLFGSFDPPVSIPAGATYVVEIDVPASTTGFAVVGGNTAGETAPTYLRAAACGIGSYVTYAAIGFPDNNWAVTVLGQEPGKKTPCPEDIDGSGTVDGGDLGILLSQWGGSGSADLDGSGTVDGGDLGILLAAWGDCPQG